MKTNIGLYERQIRDTNLHKIPDTTTEKPIDVRAQRILMAKVYNTLDQDLTVQLRGTTFDDKEYDETALDVEVTVVAGETKVLVTEVNWCYLQITAQSLVAPTTGTLKVVFQEG